MAGTGNAPIGAMKGNFQDVLLMFIVELRNMLGEYPASSRPTQGQQQRAQRQPAAKYPANVQFEPAFSHKRRGGEGKHQQAIYQD